MISLVNVSKHIKEEIIPMLHRFFQKIGKSEILTSWFYAARIRML